MALVAVNGVHFNVERAGAGPALVLLHGFTGSATTWAPHVPVFARDFDTVAIDLLGHGASAVPAEPARYRMEQAVADLTGLLDRLGIARAAVARLLDGRADRAAGCGCAARKGRGAGARRRRARDRRPDRAGGADPRRRGVGGFIEREGMEAFVDRWQRLPLFATQARLPAEARAALRRQRLANDPVGLANTLRGHRARRPGAPP